MEERRGYSRRVELTEAAADQAGDFFTEHRRYIENVARQHAPTPDDVPDIVQMVGIKVCRGLGGFRGDANQRTWLYRVTVNTARDYYRRERRHLRAVEAVQATPLPDRILDPDEDATQNERAHALHEAVERLRPKHATAIRNLLAGSPVLSSSVKATRHRARRQLADILATDPRILQD